MSEEVDVHARAAVRVHRRGERGAGQRARPRRVPQPLPRHDALRVPLGDLLHQLADLQAERGDEEVGAQRLQARREGNLLPGERML